MAAENTPSHVHVLRPSRRIRRPPSHRMPSSTEEPSSKSAQLDTSHTTTSQTLEESAQSSIIDSVPQTSKPSSLSKGLGIEHSSQLTKNHYATSSLVSLPLELQATIASFLLRQTDLNALSRTCKTLRVTSLPKLYRRVDVRIPVDHFRLDALEALLLSSGEGLKSTRQLRILPQQGPLHPLQDFFQDDKVDNDKDQEREHDYHPGSRASSLFNLLIRQLIMEIPINCLQMFEWRHTCPMEKATLVLLLERQEPRCLRLEGFTVDSTTSLIVPTVSALEELRIGSLEPDQIVNWLAPLVAANFSTLQHLEIGVENKVVDCRLDDQLYHDKNSDQLTKRFRRELAACLAAEYGPSYPALPVSSLTLVGLSLLDLEDGKVGPIIDWTNLRALAIKSCSQLDGMLSFLQSVIPSVSGEGGNLESFDLRSETRGDALKKFLTSFNGLVHLGLLLEDGTMSLATLQAALKNHGPTLRRLIWDVRLQEWISSTKDESLATCGNDHVPAIVRRCPLLEELGLSLDWIALMDPRGKPSGSLKKVVQKLRLLKHLRTLHIRNPPALREEEEIWSLGVSDDERSEVFVTRLVRALVACRPEQPPILETVALGILKYRDICAGKASRHENNRINEFLKLRVYHVEYQRNFQGDCIPVITLIAKGTTDAIQDICDNIKILQSAWLA